MLSSVDSLSHQNMPNALGGGFIREDQFISQFEHFSYSPLFYNSALYFKYPQPTLTLYLSNKTGILENDEGQFCEIPSIHLYAISYSAEHPIKILNTVRSRNIFLNYKKYVAIPCLKKI